MPVRNGSKFKGLVRYPLPNFRDKAPLDAGLVTVLANNLEMAYAGSMQVRVNTMLRAPIQIGSQTDILGAGGTRKIGTFGPFPLSILKNGSPAPLYVQVAFAANSGGAGSATVVLVLREITMPGAPSAYYGQSNYGSAATSATTVAWQSISNANSLLVLSDSFALPSTIQGQYSNDNRFDVGASALQCVIDAYAYTATAGVSGVQFQGIIAKEVPYLEDYL